MMHPGVSIAASCLLVTVFGVQMGSVRVAYGAASTATASDDDDRVAQTQQQAAPPQLQQVRRRQRG